jgi:hypothetical protein
MLGELRKAEFQIGPLLVHSPDWLKSKNPEAPAVQHEAERCQKVTLNHFYMFGRSEPQFQRPHS